jgi:hypothetical protein
MLVIFLISVVAGVLRFMVHGTHGVVSWEDTYEAVAHIWVGYLLAVCFLRPQVRRGTIGCLAVISAIELVMFFVDK